MTATRGFVGVSACAWLLGLSLPAQTDQESACITRLETVQRALTGIRLEYESHRTPGMKREELVRRWGIRPATLDSSRCEFRKDGGRWICLETYFSRSRGEDPHVSSEWRSSCNGDAVFLAGDPNVIYTRSHLVAEGNRSAFILEYLSDVRLKPASKPANFDGPGVSLVLDDLRRADATRFESQNEFLVLTVRLGNRSRIYELDPRLGLAVARWSERVGDRLFRTVACEDFVEVHGIYWPRRVESTWYGWVTKGAEICEKPGMTVVHEVRAISPYSGSDSFQIEFDHGSAVFDMRHSDAETAYHGFLSHVVPVPPDELLERFLAGYREGESRLSTWVVVVLTSLAAGLLILQWWRRAT